MITLRKPLIAEHQRQQAELWESVSRDHPASRLQGRNSGFLQRSENTTSATRHKTGSASLATMNMLTDESIKLMGKEDDSVMPPMPNGKSSRDARSKAKRASCTNCRQSKVS